MISVKNNQSLLSHNSFGLDVFCKYFCDIFSIEDFLSLINQKVYLENFKLVLGGGSNILFRSDFEGIVIKNNLKGIALVKETSQNYFVKVGAGENWHQFVLWCLNKNYSGLENLSLIPGNVGAGPMQNIGAYGVEIKDVFQELEAVDLLTGEKVIFQKNDCEFGYRESIFKRKFKNKFLITSVIFKLDKIPNFNTSYGAIEQELEKMEVKNKTIQAISQAVINIRTSKLPDPLKIGNAGSFFKNPEISFAKFSALKNDFPDLVSYPLANGNYKLAAGWLIEQTGWKGKRVGDAGVHNAQALVLVNYGKAKGDELFTLSQNVLLAVQEKFGVELEREVNIVP